MASLTVTDLRERLARCTPAELAEIDALTAHLPPQSFKAFCAGVTLPNFFQWFPHIEALGRLLEDVVAGKVRRAMIFLPPQHGKSHTFSELGTAYYLRQHPDRTVAVTSYSDEMALLRSKAARRYYTDQVDLSDDSQAAKYWQTEERGGLWASGVGGSATGKGFHFGIIDDPIKDYQDACSETIRQRAQDWYDAVFATRQRPGAAIVLICTRWHELDLAGFLLAREAVSPQHWTILSLPGLSEARHAEFPPTCTVLPDWRTGIDEPLCEGILSKEALEERKATNPHFFAALYQQHPQPREGGMFQRDWFDVVASSPLEGTVVRFWDCAATKDGGDFTAGVRIKRTPKGEYFIEDVVTGRWDSGTRDSIIKRTAQADGFHVKQRREQEPGSAGKDAGLAFVRLLEGFSASYAPATGDKVDRADPFASQCQARMVKLVRGPWNQSFLDELTAFPTGAHDDQVDAASGAFAMLAKKRALDVSPGGLETENWTRMGR